MNNTWNSGIASEDLVNNSICILEYNINKECFIRNTSNPSELDSDTFVWVNNMNKVDEDGNKKKIQKGEMVRWSKLKI